MAGAFPDSFGRRLPWDADGTVMLWLPDDKAAVEFDATQRAAGNSEEGILTTVSTTDKGYLCHIFPELRDLDGYFLSRETGGFGTYSELETSVDTTNGLDGVWVQSIADIAEFDDTSPDYRDSVIQISVSAIKAIRVRKAAGAGASNRRIKNVHIYGNISSAQTPDRIIILDTDNSDEIFALVLDYGDVPRGQTQTRTVKLKNNSSSKTINTVTITAEDLHLNAGDWFTFGDDNVVFVTTFSVGNLGPGDTKLIYVKQIIPSGETLGLQAGRIKIDHATVV